MNSQRPSYLRKVVSRDRLTALVQRARRAGKSVALCHGCFDIVHPGHIRYLEYARRQGDLLVVSLTGDSNIEKGPQRPYIPQELRAENLAALSCVDLVYIDPNPTAEQTLANIKPDVYVKGREYEQSADPGFAAERSIVEQHGGRVVFSSGEIVFSSSRLIDALDRDESLESHRLAAICARHNISEQTVGSLIDRFRRLRVLVVGDTIVDRYVFCDAPDVASEAPVLSLKQLDERTYVGGSAIVARHVAAMGATATLVTSAPPDHLTADIEHVLDADNVQTHMIRHRPDLVEKTRFLADDQKLFKLENARNVPLDSLAERRAIALLEDRLDATDVVIFCDFGYGMITAGLLAAVLPRLRARVPTITADVSGPRADLLGFRTVDLLCPTERELRTNLHDFETGLSSVAHHLLTATQAKSLIVTLEKKGLVTFARPTTDPESPEWSARLHTEHLPSFANRPVDRLGGGDALLSVASLTLAVGGSLMQAAYLGNAAAALEINLLGNVPISASQLDQWIAHPPELIAAPPTGAPGSHDSGSPYSESPDDASTARTRRQRLADAART